MKAISAYRAEDGSLHETRESAAIADLILLGFDAAAAARIIEMAEQVESVLRDATGRGYIPAYFPPPAEAA